MSSGGMSPLPPRRPRESHGELSALLTWHPTRWLAAAFALLLVMPIAQALHDYWHLVPGGIEVDTDGEDGMISDGQYTINLPVHVYNGTSNTIYGVSLWVNAFACPEANSSIEACRRIAAFSQDLAMTVSPNSATSFQQQVSGGLPETLPGEHLRIERKVERITDENDRKRESYASYTF